MQEDFACGVVCSLSSCLFVFGNIPSQHLSSTGRTTHISSTYFDVVANHSNVRYLHTNNYIAWREIGIVMYISWVLNYFRVTVSAFHTDLYTPYYLHNAHRLHRLIL